MAQLSYEEKLVIIELIKGKIQSVDTIERLGDTPSPQEVEDRHILYGVLKKWRVNF